MEITIGSGGRVRVLRRVAVSLTALLLFTTMGCAIESREGKSSPAGETKSEPEPKSSTATDRKSDGGPKRSPTSGTTEATRQEATPAAAGNLVRLTQRGCVQLEPHWASIRAGQSLTLQSDLASAVTVHVAGGAFDREVYVVPAGKKVSTGPARAPGSYAIWTEPAACQGVPLGSRGSGPGVTVEAGR